MRFELVVLRRSAVGFIDLYIFFLKTPQRAMQVLTF
jgi:hypothetical protein